MKMKNILKIAPIIGAIASSTLLSGCLQETFPTDVATQKQVQSSANATENLVGAITTQAKSIYSDPYSWGYGAIMHVRDAMTADIATLSYQNWDWFWFWTDCKEIGAPWAVTQFIWEWQYQYVLTTNNVIGLVDPEKATDFQKGALAIAYANRAMIYLDLARMYEFLPNDKTVGKSDTGKDITGLTVPIVKAGMDQQQMANNPRAKKEDMVKFIKEDLDQAEKYMKYVTDTKGNTFPNIACVEGLRARLYMWLEDYPNAKKYARLAIDKSGVPIMTKEDCLDINKGFNDISKWMWGVQYTDQDAGLKSEWANWTCWMSNEVQYGYTAKGATQMIGRSVYDRISDNDWRKLEFKAPEGSPLYDKVPFLNATYKEKLPAYASLKFRPNKGDDKSFKVGQASAYPMMRVEEMYLIEAEAAAHQNLAEGKKLLEQFMKTRNDKYECKAKTQDDLVEEIVFQKRVELWGEGQSFFDIKRLNYSVTRGYPGTNFVPEVRLNSKGRPAWMNFVIVDQEIMSNPILRDQNNPDPSEKYSPWIGE